MDDDIARALSSEFGPGASSCTVEDLTAWRLAGKKAEEAARAQDWDGALKSVRETIELRPAWAKGYILYSRAALASADEHSCAAIKGRCLREAVSVVDAGLEIVSASGSDVLALQTALEKLQQRPEFWLEEAAASRPAGGSNPQAVFLIRHGQSEGQTATNRNDPSLLDCGLTRKGACQATACWKQEPPDLVVCSALSRAIATALLTFASGPRILCHGTLIERGSCIPENRPRTVPQVCCRKIL